MTFDKALESHKQKMSERETELLADKEYTRLGFWKKVDGNTTTYEKYYEDVDCFDMHIYKQGVKSVEFKTSDYKIIPSLSSEEVVVVAQKLKELGWI